MMYYKGTNLKGISKNDIYKIDNPNIANLHRLGFRFRHNMSDAEDDVYEYTFPVYRYHAIISLEARFLLWQKSNILKVDVFDSTTHGIYAPWYSDNSGIHQEVIKIIDKNISREMRNIGVSLKEEA